MFRFDFVSVTFLLFGQHDAFLYLFVSFSCYFLSTYTAIVVFGCRCLFFFRGDVYLVKKYCASFNLFVGRKTNLIFNSPPPKELRNSLLTLRIFVFS